MAGHTASNALAQTHARRRRGGAVTAGRSPIVVRLALVNAEKMPAGDGEIEERNQNK
jgi:hypothetical protein